MNFEEWSVELERVASTGVWIAPLTALVAAFVFGQVVAWTYERTYRGLSYSRGFSHTLVLVCISASILVLAMQHSLIAGLGLFGILSMIRFRTDLKTARDLVFVMGAACLGVTCGVGAVLEATLGSAAFCGVALYLHTGPFGSRSRFDGVLRFDLPVRSDTDPILSQLMQKYCRRLDLLSATTIGDGSLREHVYQVKFFRDEDRTDLVEALTSELNVQGARLMLEDGATEY
jgi:hypothetical protein